MHGSAELAAEKCFECLVGRCVDMRWKEEYKPQKDRKTRNDRKEFVV